MSASEHTRSTASAGPRPTPVVTHFDESDAFGPSDLAQLAADTSATAISLYLPTHRSGTETAQDPIRLRNLVASVERELAVIGWHPREIAALLAPVTELLDDADRWRFQSDGLAVFCSPGHFHAFRLPIAFSELAVVQQGFHLRPLLPLIVPHEQFWLLALSQNSVRMFRGTRRSIAEIDLGATPRSMAEALAHEDLEKGRQIRSTGPNGRGQSYSHAGGAEDDKAALERYFQAVARGISELALDASVPLVLAAVSYYGPIFRRASDHPDILDQVVAGSPDDLTPAELHPLAWAVVEPHLATRHVPWPDRFGSHQADGRTAEGLIEVTTAATEGRVELLVLPHDGYVWANRDQPRPTVHDERETGDVDLLDVLAQRVLGSGGEVIVVDNDQLPTDAVPAAVLRYG